MQNISIITPVSRVEYLEMIKKNIQEELSPYFNVTWYCIYDISKGNDIVHKEDWIKSYQGGFPNDCGGGSQRNIALKMIKSGWIFCLDDDNLLYKGFGKRMEELTLANPSFKAFVFNQDCCGHRRNLLASRDNVKVGEIDMAQILFSADIVGETKFMENNYCADGDFIEKIYSPNKMKFLFLNETLCYWNALKPRKNTTLKVMRGTPPFVNGLKKLIQTIKDNGMDVSNATMIEIGSYSGESTAIFAEHFKKIISVDCWDNAHQNDPDNKYLPLSEVEKVFDERAKNLGNVTKLKMKSDDAIFFIRDIIAPKTPIHFVYIDGDHSYDQVKKDIDNYLPLLAKDCFIGGHDFSDDLWHTKKAVIDTLGDPQWSFEDTSWLFKAGVAKNVNAPDRKKYGSELSKEQSAFHIRIPHLLIVDSFYKDPDVVRGFAMSQGFESDERYFKGKRTGKFLFPSVKEEFERLLGIRITDWLTQPANGIFQITSAKDPLVWHSDHQHYAGAIYLTPNADTNTGTSFWRDKKYGCRRPPNHHLENKNAPISKIYSEYNLLHPDNWELVDKVGNIYNRLVIWDAQMIHSATHYGGDDRLVQLFFFSAEG